MPPPDEYRHLNRVPLREPVHLRKKRRHNFVMVTACLIILALFSAATTQLGSNDGALEQNQVTDLTGTITTIHSQVVGSTEMDVPADFDQQDISEFHQTIIAGEYRITGLLRTSIGSKSIWSLIAITEVNGRQVETGITSGDHPSADFDEDFVTLYRDHMEDLMSRVRNTPPTRTETVESDGYLFLMKVWQHDYPGLGQVEYAEGSPVRPLE